MDDWSHTAHQRIGEGNGGSLVSQFQPVRVYVCEHNTIVITSDNEGMAFSCC